MVMKRFIYIFFATLLTMMWLGINVYADEYDGLDFDYGSVLVQLKPQITDDMYMEWTEEDTKKDLLNILLDAIPGFEFPRFPLSK